MSQTAAKKILLVMIEPPLPFGGAAARWFYVLYTELVKRGHKVTAFSVCSKPEEMALARKLFPSEQYDLRLYSTCHKKSLKKRFNSLLRPFSYMFSQEFLSDLGDELKKDYDIVHLEQTWSGWLARDVADKTLLNVHHFISIDLEMNHPKNFSDWYSKMQIHRAEKKLVLAYKNVRACSPRLENKMREWGHEGKINSIPVALDLDQYEWIKTEARPHKKIITLVGSMHWYPSASAARRVLDDLWPEIKKLVPEAELRIIGWNAKSVLKDYQNIPGVLIEENVKDIRLYFEETSVFLYPPARGSGMKIKILEAMAWGIPVVTTSEGVEGLQIIEGVHAFVAEDNENLIRKTVRLLLEPELQESFRNKARALLETEYSKKVTVDKIESFYQQIVKGI